MMFKYLQRFRNALLYDCMIAYLFRKKVVKRRKVVVKVELECKKADVEAEVKEEDKITFGSLEMWKMKWVSYLKFLIYNLDKVWEGL